MGAPRYGGRGRPASDEGGRGGRTDTAVPDLAEGDAFTMTHQFLGPMLGVRRAGVSVATSASQKAGLIRYGQGRMEITDRDGLENLACVGYDTDWRTYQRLFGLPPGTMPLHGA